MSSLRASSEPAYLIHTRVYRETSLIIEAFSLEHGKVSLIAKGVRKKNSPTAGLLQPFKELSLSWQGRSELQILTGVEMIGDRDSMQGKAIFCGFYLNELMAFLLTKYDPHPALYHHYKKTLADLTLADSYEAILRYFEIKLLEEIGYGLNLECECRTGAALLSEQQYLYDVEEGAIVFNEGSHSDVVLGQTLIDMQQQNLSCPRSFYEAKKLMRSVINWRIGGRPLRSRELFHNMPLTLGK
jgi:DNA repair protein RecO (recombination protein O)